MHPSSIEIAGTGLFALAVLHVFLVKRFRHLAAGYPEGSLVENLFQLLGEVEIVFGLWAGVLVGVIAFLSGGHEAVSYVEKQSFTEPLFVFAIMAAASTAPIVQLCERFILLFSPLGSAALLIATLSLGPLLGSLITEPAAMTVSAILIKRGFLDRELSNRLKYLILGTLFVNVSIGGVLTHFAAPPVLMVAGTWGWDLSFMFQHFGWKACVAIFIDTVLLAVVFRRELAGLAPRAAMSPTGCRPAPLWLSTLHIAFLAVIVVTAHYPSFFLGVFLFFLGVVSITREYQEELRLKESLLVAFFLGGLVVLGGLQAWWLRPLLESLSPLPLFLGSAGLTAIIDNAALTYLGAQVSGLSSLLQYALVAGAVTGGGLTVIANAPNPAGFAILRDSFGTEGISPGALFAAALVPTVIAALCFWCLGF